MTEEIYVCVCDSCILMPGTHDGWIKRLHTALAQGFSHVKHKIRG